MGDKDDLTMESILNQIRNIPGYEDVVPDDPWDDDKLTPNKFPTSQSPISIPEAEDSEDSDDLFDMGKPPHSQFALSQSPPAKNYKNVSIIRTIEEALKNGALIDSRLTEGKTKETPTTKTTEAGIKDLKNVRLEELCEFIESDVDLSSAGGEYLLSLYHGYQLMIKRIVERYPKGSYKNPADYLEREIFDAISGIMEEEEISEIIFDLTGEDEADGGIAGIAGLVFNGLNERFMQHSGWTSGEDIVTLLNRPESGNPSTSVPKITSFFDLDLSAKTSPYEDSGSMHDDNSAMYLDYIKLSDKLIKMQGRS